MHAVGISVTSKEVILVDANVDHVSNTIEIQSDFSMRVQGGDRATAYAALYQQLLDYFRDHKIDVVVVKASAINRGPGGTRLGQLEGCEVRGVAMAAAGAVTKSQSLAKAKISREFGTRKVDEYLKDESFWASRVTGKLRVKSREAALLLIAGPGSPK